MSIVHSFDIAQDFNSDGIHKLLAFSYKFVKLVKVWITFWSELYCSKFQRRVKNKYPIYLGLSLESSLISLNIKSQSQ